MHNDIGLRLGLGDPLAELRGAYGKNGKDTPGSAFTKEPSVRRRMILHVFMENRSYYIGEEAVSRRVTW